MLVELNVAEIEAIEDALEYLLGAELLPENGYTEEVVQAIKSSLAKMQKAQKNPSV